MSLPCYLHDEADSHTCILVGTAETVDNIEFLAGQLVDGDFLNSSPGLFSHRLVVVGIFLGCPPYIVAGVIVEYDEFILGRTAGIYTGHYVYGAEFGYNAFFKTFECRAGLCLEELVIAGVVDHLFDILDAILG